MKTLNLRAISLIFLFFCLVLPLSLFGQYSKVEFENSNVPEIEIIQIDQYELSTMIHFIYQPKHIGMISSDENFYLKSATSGKKYRLLNSINIPLGMNQFHLVSEPGKEHAFSLEFERIPDQIDMFDIIEEAERGFNWDKVKVDWKENSSPIIEIGEFIVNSPLNEINIFYQDGQPVMSKTIDGVTVAILMSGSRDYGKYYQANFLIDNLSGESINFNPRSIKVIGYKKDKQMQLEVLSHEKYAKKVKRSQNWTAIAYGLSEGMAAYNAGTTTTYSATNSFGSSNTTGSAFGQVGDSYGSIYANSSTYGSTYSTTYSQTYDGAAAYAAQQQANRNTSELNQAQYEIRQTLNEGYLKLNTLTNETQYVGFINIDFQKVEALQLTLFLNGNEYLFQW